MSTQYAMVATISTHARPTVHQRHNRRDPAVVQAEDHIDPRGVHEEWLDVDELDAYREIFGDAVERYNERQQREDRKLTVDGYWEDLKCKELAGTEYNKRVRRRKPGPPRRSEEAQKAKFQTYEL